tara:strand:- start:57 stop:323 length:267 start_codon:yes stop_codon:yes gene_type:complete
MEKSENIYCGSGTEKTFSEGRSIVNFSVRLSKLKDHVYEYNGEKYVNLTLGANRDGANDYGKTHYVKVNTFKPEPQTTEKKKEDALPF